MITLKSALKEWLTPTMILGAIIAGAWFASDYIARQEEKEKILKEITFENSKQKHQVIEHSMVPYNPVNVYLQNDTVSKRQDTLIRLQLNLDTILRNIYIQKEREAIEKKKQDSLDLIRELQVQKNREERNKIQTKILYELEVINLRQADFKKQLQSIKKDSI